MSLNYFAFCFFLAAVPCEEPTGTTGQIIKNEIPTNAVMKRFKVKDGPGFCDLMKNAHGSRFCTTLITEPHWQSYGFTPAVANSIPATSTTTFGELCKCRACGKVNFFLYTSLITLIPPPLLNRVNNKKKQAFFLIGVLFLTFAKKQKEPIWVIARTQRCLQSLLGLLSNKKQTRVRWKV